MSNAEGEAVELFVTLSERRGRGLAVTIGRKDWCGRSPFCWTPLVTSSSVPLVGLATSRFREEEEDAGVNGVPVDPGEGAFRFGVDGGNGCQQIRC